MIAIIGATGKIGSKIVAELLARGKQIKAIGRDLSKLETIQNKGVAIAAGDINDAAFLTNEFKEATAVLLIIPPDMQTADIAAFQKKVGEAQLEAIVNTGIKNISFISSLGAENTGNGSIVAGLGEQERRLNALPDDVNVISLRPTGFMENLFNQIGMIKHKNIISSPVKGNLKTGIIATADIAAVAAERLDKLDFKGKSSLNLLGSKDYSQKEIAAIIGRAIGRPHIAYVETSYEENKKTLMEFGISESVANAMNVMWKNINDGLSIVPNCRNNNTNNTRIFCRA